MVAIEEVEKWFSKESNRAEVRYKRAWDELKEHIRAEIINNRKEMKDWEERGENDVAEMFHNYAIEDTMILKTMIDIEKKYNLDKYLQY